MTNSFTLYWNTDWKFQIVHMAGGNHIEGYGLGLFLRAPFLPTDNPIMAADKLVFDEDRKRKSLSNSWRRMEKGE